MDNVYLAFEPCHDEDESVVAMIDPDLVDLNLNSNGCMNDWLV